MRRGTGWTTAAWRLLCLLATMSGLAAVTGLFSALPPLWMGVVSIPGLVVMLLLFVAWWADCSSSRTGSTKR